MLAQNASLVLRSLPNVVDLLEMLVQPQTDVDTTINVSHAHYVLSLLRMLIGMCLGSQSSLESLIFAPIAHIHAPQPFMFHPHLPWTLVQWTLA